MQTSRRLESVAATSNADLKKEVNKLMGDVYEKCMPSELATDKLSYKKFQQAVCTYTAPNATATPVLKSIQVATFDANAALDLDK